MLGKPLIDKPFGPLQGVRIVSSGTIIAQPFAAELAAEMGAEVIQIERPGSGDATRGRQIQRDAEYVSAVLDPIRRDRWEVTGRFQFDPKRPPRGVARPRPLNLNDLRAHL